MVGYDSSTDSKFGLSSEAESMVGSDSASLAGFVRGTLVGFETTHFSTKEWFQPAIFQSAKGNFQHYVHWPYSMYTTHEGTPSDSAQILHRYNTGLILDLVLLLDRSLLLFL